jgi:hypothetical protein
VGAAQGRSMETLRGQFSEMVLLPAVASALPWSLNYALQRQVSRLSFIYGKATDQAEKSAKASGLFETGQVWRRQYRLNRIVDGTDPWISLTRSDRWLARHVVANGAWPSEGPFVATSMHWGTGLWAMRHIQHQRGPNSLVMRPESEWGDTVSWPMRRYYRWVERIVARSGGAPPIFTGPGIRGRIEGALAEGRIVMAMLDVPRSLSRERQAYDFLGEPAYFASGVINIAVNQGIPVVPFSIGLDYETGKRQLHIEKPITGKSTHDTMSDISKFFDLMVRNQPTAWHLWHLHQAFLSSEPPEQPTS